MTALEIVTTPEPATDGIGVHVDAAPVRWEPCTAFVDDGGHTCAACGWLGDDHDGHPSTGTVVALPARPVLRRAS